MEEEAGITELNCHRQNSYSEGERSSVRALRGVRGGCGVLRGFLRPPARPLTCASSHQEVRRASIGISLTSAEGLSHKLHDGSHYGCWCFPASHQCGRRVDKESTKKKGRKRDLDWKS